MTSVRFVVAGDQVSFERFVVKCSESVSLVMTSHCQATTRRRQSSTLYISAQPPMCTVKGSVDGVVKGAPTQKRVSFQDDRPFQGTP